MPYSAGPNIAARPNLVFEYDTGDVQNSYKGEPTTNQYTNPAFTNGTTGWTFGSWDSANFTYSVENVLGPFGQVIPALKITRTGSSTFAHFHQNNSGKYTTGNQYTLSAYVIGAGTLRGNSQWTGIETSFTLSSQWQRVSYTVTAPNNSSYPYWAAEAITQNVPMYFVFAQSEQKSHVTPYIDGTRSNTQGLLDVSGLGNTIDLANMSYTSTAQFTFDGTDDYSLITNSSALQIVDNITIESVVRVNSSNLGNVKVMANKYYTTGWEFVLGTDGTFALGGRNGDGTYYSSNSGVVIADNKFHHVVGIKSGLYWQTYVDGVLKSTLTASSIGTLSNSGDVQLGKEGSSYFTAMSMNMFRIYNVGLSATQVLQNYNQLKGRFNLQ